MNFPRLLILALLALTVAGCATPRHGATDATVTARFEAVSFRKLPGWRADDALAAWPAIVSSCAALGSRAEWQSFCGAVVATSPMDAEFARGFLEQHLRPYKVWRVTGRKREKTGLVTGYYEPLLRGSREKTAQFATPL
jgi:membrane-bound lytic murein transglycosylase A